MFLKQEPVKKNHYPLPICLLGIVVVFLLAPFVTRADNQRDSCSGNICVTSTDDLPKDVQTIAENKSVTLGYAIYNKNNPSASICSNGSDLFYVLKHYSGSAYDYQRRGGGAGFSYTFNSSGDGNQNRYQAIFYCDVGPLTSNQNSIVDNTLNKVSQKWYSSEFNKTTSNATASTATTVLFSNARQVGQSLNISVHSYPDTYKEMVINVNGKKVRTPSVSYTLTISKEAGFNESGSNTISVVLYDSAGKEIPTAQNTLSFVPGQAAAASPTTTSVSGGGTSLDKCTGDNNNPDCVHNPLPTDSLIGTFLLIGRGFFVLIGAWAVLFIIVGGFRMVMAQGNEEDYAKAKKTITWAILGVVIASLSFSMVAIVQNLLKAKVQTSVIDKTQTR